MGILEQLKKYDEEEINNIRYANKLIHYNVKLVNFALVVSLSVWVGFVGFVLSKVI